MKQRREKAPELHGDEKRKSRMKVIKNTNSYKKTFLNDDVARSSGVMFIATILAGAFSYIYQVYMGRALGPEEYAIFGALFAIFYMISVVTQTISTSITRFVSTLRGEGKEIGVFVLGSLKRTSVLGFASALLFLAFSGAISSALKINDAKPVAILALILFLSWSQPVFGGALRGIQRFKALGSVSVSNSFLKLLSGVLLVSLGLGIVGALLGVALGVLAALLISFFLIAPYLKKNNPHEPEISYSSLYTYSLPVMLAMFCMSVPANLDVILAKYFFSALDAGLYTSASVLGKIIFFFPAAVYAVMFPMITERHVRGENSINVLKKSLIYTAILSGSAALIYLLFPQLVLKVFGSSYVSALPLVAPYGLTMFFFSLTVIILYYHLAIKNFNYVALFAFFTLIEILLLLFFHSSPLEMVKVLLSVNSALFGASLIYTWRMKL